MFNFKRRRNLAMFICFMMIIAWNFKIGFDFAMSDFKSFAILNFSAVLFFFLALGTSIRSKKMTMKAYQAHVRANRVVE